VNDREVLLFDLGGVLVHFEGFEALNRLFGSRFDAAEIRSRWLACSAVTEFECGLIPPAEFAERFVAEWELDWSPEHFLAAFTTWARPFSSEVTSLLAELSSSYELACLSNCNVVHWAHLETDLSHFDSAFLSFEIGIAKPDPRIFEQVVAELDRPPDRITFFDDTEENVHAAQALGIRSELVRGMAEVRARLTQLGKVRGGSRQVGRQGSGS
jgi:putative hydrolase of the HAD superfamily